MGLQQNDPIYALEPVMHKGDHYEPGEEITGVDENDIGAILSSGRGTQEADAAKKARKQFAAAKAAAEAAAKEAEKQAAAPLANAIAEAIAAATKAAATGN